MKEPNELPNVPLRNLTVKKVSELGLPSNKIDVDLELKDISLFWANKEPTLWLIIAICSIIFLFILTGVL